MTETPNLEKKVETSGDIAAALLSLGVGCAAFGILVTLSEASTSIADRLNIYQPTGPLSGKSTVAILIWLVAWAALARVLRGRNVPLKRAFTGAMLLIGLGVLLAFPPVFDLLAGK